MKRKMKIDGQMILVESILDNIDKKREEEKKKKKKKW
jgi:hypothetical protein